MNKSSGFAHAAIAIGLVVFAVIGFVGFKVFSKQETSQASTSTQSQPQTKQAESDTEPPILAKNIGFKFEKYDPATKRAGDLVFKDIPALKDELVGDRIWHDYGVPDVKPGSKQKNPQTTFLLPAGTKITAMIDGEVVGITELYSKDVGIMIAKDKKSKWRYEHEHVVKPLVKIGDKVKAGQVIAEVGAHVNAYQYAGFGQFEIGLYRPHPNGVGGSEDCVFKFLDPSVKETIHTNVSAFYKGWEEFRGNTALYNESNNYSPGCAIGSTISWEKVAPPAN